MLPKMICRWGLLLVTVASLAVLAGCQRDLGIDDETFACEDTDECGDGFVCRAGRCVDADEPLPDGGDTGASDAGDTGGADASDVGTGGVDTGDAGADPQCAEYCDVYMQHCTAVAGAGLVFDSRQACLDACRFLPHHGQQGETEGDTVYCRIYHAGFAGERNDRDHRASHCGHAQPVSTGFCLETERDRCVEYCRNVAQACTDEEAVFESEEACRAVCGADAPQTDARLTGEALRCRTGYAETAAEVGDLAANCASASPRSLIGACATPQQFVISDESTEVDVSFGQAIAAGDFDGDGTRDLAIGAPRSDGNETRGGRVYLFYGPIDGPRSASQAHGTFIGSGLNGLVGASLTAGDVDGMRGDELVIGAPGAAAVYVLPGSSRRTGEFTIEDVADVVTLTPGPVGASGFGESLAMGQLGAGAGPDLVVGDPLLEVSSNTGGGAWVIWDEFVIGGSASLQSDAVYFFDSDSARANALGTSVAVLGDIDGDGSNDIAIGDPQPTASDERAGYVQVLLGVAGRGAHDIATYPKKTTILAPAVAASGGALLGNSLAGGDVMGDGSPDLLIGAPAWGAGATYAVAGGTTRFQEQEMVLEEDASGEILRFEGEQTGDHLGSALATVPWCGGKPLLAIGADAGAASAGAVYLVEAAWGASLSAQYALTLAGAGVGDQFGWRVTALGDLNDDGSDDFGIGAPAGDAGGAPGYVSIVLMPACTGGQ